MKLRRSVLYVPGNKPRALEKSRGLAVDCVIYDLEDSVGPDSKDEARNHVLAALSVANSTGQERVVRINGLQSDWVEQDVAALADSGAEAVLLPKIESADDIAGYRDMFEVCGHHKPVFWVMVETPSAIINISEIIAADAAIAVIVMGLEDLALETRIRKTPGREGFAYTLGTCLMAARAHGVDIIDGVYTTLNDEAGFKAECEQSSVLGFDGKSLIHPGQVETCNRCFSPDEAQVRWAQKIITAWDDQRTPGHSVVVVDGRMIEHLHVTEARRILALQQLDLSKNINNDGPE